MKRRYILAALAVALVAAAPRSAAAQCSTGCAVGKRTCMAEARTAFSSCRATCRSSTSAHCRTSCLADVLAARKACRLDLTECRTSCPPPSPCTGACGQQMASCMQGVQMTGKRCAQDCLDQGRSTGAACRQAADPASCLRAATTQVAACLRGCANNVHDGAAGCAAMLRGCLAACQGGSPSGAFLE